MAKTVIDGVAGLKALVGKTLGSTGWKEMTYEAIVKFADATGDHQWIHVDKERIARESPYKKPIAHGYFSLSLIAGLFFDLVDMKGFGMTINYGLNKVRFPSALKEGQKYRLSCTMAELKEVQNAYECVMNCTVEIEGETKPACAAEVVFRFYAR
jgi:acyl dehydratase